LLFTKQIYYVIQYHFPCITSELYILNLLKHSFITNRVSYIVLLLVLVSVSFLLVQQGVAQPRNILFDHYTTANGLSNNAVWDIYKTRQGYVWLGTQDGLSRFDGQNFKVFRHSAKDSTSISDNVVYKLLEDAEGYLWTGTFNGLSRYNPAFGNFVHIKPGDFLSKLTKRVGIGDIKELKSDSSIWVGTTGLYYVDKKTLTMESAPGRLNEEVFKDGGI
jgi:ligand-binding sensor domain-containing protein